MNSALDQTNRSERLVYVNSASDQALRCVIGVARSQGGETSEHVYTNRDVCLEPDVGNAVMMLTTRRGHFTFEWIDSAELMSWSHNGQE